MEKDAGDIGKIAWYTLVALNSGRPMPVAEPLILSAIQSVPLPCTAVELRRELAELETRGFVRLTRHDDAPWLAGLTARGIGMLESGDYPSALPETPPAPGT